MCKNVLQKSICIHMAIPHLLNFKTGLHRKGISATGANLLNQLPYLFLLEIHSDQTSSLVNCISFLRKKSQQTRLTGKKTKQKKTVMIKICLSCVRE